MMTSSYLEHLQETANSKGKVLLIESTGGLILPSGSAKVFDTPELIESNGQQYMARGVLDAVPVTRFTENLNKRIYPVELWERIQELKAFDGRSCLADHAKESGSVKDTCGIWHHFRIIEDCGVADIYCVGDNGSLMLEVVQAGGKVGYSTVGFGEFMADGRTVKPDSYELNDNACDWVFNPSQQVYGSDKNLTVTPNNNEINTPVAESKPMPSTVFAPTVLTNSKGNSQQLMESKPMTDTITVTKLYEANFINQARALIVDADEGKNDQKSLKELELFSKGLPDTEGLKETRSTVLSLIDVLSKKLKERLSAKEEELAQKNESFVSLTDKHTILDEAHQELAQRYETLGGLASKMKESLDNENEDTLLRERDLTTYEVREKKSYATFKKMNEDIQRMSDETVLRERDLAVLCKLIERMAVKLKENGLYPAREFPEMTAYHGFKSSIVEYNARMDNPELGNTPAPMPRMTPSLGTTPYTAGNDKPELGGTGYMPSQTAGFPHMPGDDMEYMPGQDMSFMGKPSYMPADGPGEEYMGAQDMSYMGKADMSYMPPEDEMSYMPLSPDEEGHSDMAGEAGGYGYMGMEDPAAMAGMDTYMPMEYPEGHVPGKPVQESAPEAHATGANVETGSGASSSGKSVQESAGTDFASSPDKPDRIVSKYFEEVKVKHPILENVKAEILSSSSIIGAVAKVNAYLKEDSEKPVSLVESRANHKPDWLGNRW